MVHIDETSFGSITVDGETYFHDVWIFADGSVQRRDRDHEFTVGELHQLLEGGPEIVIVGTGQSGCVRVERAVLTEAGRRGLKIIEEPTPGATRYYNEVVRRGRKVAGAFHVTC